MIDLDTLERLTMGASNELNGWWTEDDFAEGFPAPPEVNTYLAACDPATVTALVRAVKTASDLKTVLDVEDDPRWDGENEYSALSAALAPFRTTEESAR